MSTTEIPVITEKHERVDALDVFNHLKTRIRETEAKGEKPVIVYDMDGTLFDNRSRVMKIIADMIMTPEGRALDKSIIQKIATIKARNMKYGIKDTLRAHGIEDEKVLDWFQQGWTERFFTNEFVMFDVPVLGAKKFVDDLYNFGVISVYLTGRDTPGMRAGTERSLAMHEFPAPRGDQTFLITKPTFEQSDIEYKMEAIEKLKEMGTVIAVFDNEPKPMNILARAFPEANSYFLETLHSTDHETLDEGIQLMKNFFILDE